MAKSDATPLTIHIDGERTVSGLLTLPANARAVYVLAPAAGSGMEQSFLVKFAPLLAERGIATLRYQFPNAEAGSRRPDAPAAAHAAVRGAVAEAARLKLPIVAGGKSFGGRMTSQAEAGVPLGVAGLAFIGFPLHPPGKPATTRADHLADVNVPMLFLQGTRDELAEIDLLQPAVEKLGPRATLHLIPEADHSFRVPAKTGRREADVMAELADTLAAWIDGLIG
ncbi:MAG TPA: alpha/beta family hydrolase [Bauldia sp.]|nr:alpha/beta family hydrolase [Bauldia sp.]